MKATTKFCILLLLSTSIFGDNYNGTIEEKSICESRDPSRDIAFVRVGRYRGFTNSGAEYQKTYLFSRFARADFFGAKSICKSFDLELASFETLTEAHTFLNMCEENSFISSLELTWIYVDGMTTTLRSTTDWYWTSTGNKVSFDIPWAPYQPDGYNDKEYCLTILSVRHGFNDGSCQFANNLPFICQRVDFFIPVRAN